MKLTPLLSIPLALAVASCSSPPEIKVSGRAEAMSICAAENETAMRKVAQERQLIEDKPYLFNSDRDDYYDNFEWSFLHSNKWQDIEIIRTYCQPYRNSKHKDYYYVRGYIEYLTVPTDESPGDKSEVQAVISSHSIDYKK